MMDWINARTDYEFLSGLALIAAAAFIVGLWLELKAERKSK